MVNDVFHKIPALLMCCSVHQRDRVKNGARNFFTITHFNLCIFFQKFSISNVRGGIIYVNKEKKLFFKLRITVQSDRNIDCKRKLVN